MANCAMSARQKIRPGIASDRFELKGAIVSCKIQAL
jgi:hypothetical protein